jgi:hypothetical protein
MAGLLDHGLGWALGHRLSTRLARVRFARQCRAILRTPPICRRDGAATFVSMLGTRDVRMYLLAIKSLYQHLPASAIVVVDDGTLTPVDRELLRAHLGHIEFVAASAVPLGGCPRGGTWERLLHILDRSVDSYVIQVDADVLALGPVPDVEKAVAANAAFTLSSGGEFDIVDLDEAAAYAAQYDPRHLQFHAEQVLPRLPPGLGRRYTRGSSGFAGFARGGASRATAEAFSAAMQAVMGDRWKEWGTEQVSSNYLIANSPGARVLPWSRYRCFYGEGLPADTRIAHFIGSWRYDHGVYAACARAVIAELQA